VCQSSAHDATLKTEVILSLLKTQKIKFPKQKNIREREREREREIKTKPSRDT